MQLYSQIATCTYIYFQCLITLNSCISGHVDDYHLFESNVFNSICNKYICFAYMNHYIPFAAIQYLWSNILTRSFENQHITWNKNVIIWSISIQNHFDQIGMVFFCSMIDLSIFGTVLYHLHNFDYRFDRSFPWFI